MTVSKNSVSIQAVSCNGKMVFEIPSANTFLVIPESKKWASVIYANYSSLALYSSAELFLYFMKFHSGIQLQVCVLCLEREDEHNI